MNLLLEKPYSKDEEFQKIIHGKKSLVVFVRHPGWPVCREFLTQLREHYNQLTSNGAQVLVITPSSRALLEPFIDAFGPFPFDIYGNPKRTLYKSMGHESMQKWKLLMKAGKAFITGGSKAFIPEEENQKKVVKEALKTQDIYIQGGSWIFNENGEVVWKHIDSSPEDHAPINRILQELLS